MGLCGFIEAFGLRLQTPPNSSKSYYFQQGVLSIFGVAASCFCFLAFGEILLEAECLLLY